MPAPGGWGQERRENLAELDSVLRTRLLRLDEPVDRSDWGAVVERSRALRPSRYRSFAVVASGAAVLSLAFALSLGQLFPASGHPRRDAAPLQLALHLSDGSSLVLYSGARRARFLDYADGRFAGRGSEHTTAETAGTAAIARSLTDGPVHVSARFLHAANTATPATEGPMPGDQALLSFRVFTTAGLDKTAGSAVLTCLYGVDRSAYCDGAVRLDDGMELSASGVLDPDADRFTLAVTGGSGRGVLTASPQAQA